MCAHVSSTRGANTHAEMRRGCEKEEEKKKKKERKIGSEDDLSEGALSSEECAGPYYHRPTGIGQSF